MDKILFLDLETYSAVDLKTAGTYRYAAECEILLWSYAIDEDKVKVWDVGNDPIPEDLRRAVEDKEYTFCAHYSAFDKTVLEASKFADYVAGHNWVDTTIIAHEHGLPGSLMQLCDIFGLGEDTKKSADGKALIQLFSKPHDPRATSKTHPDAWKKFIEYARLDVEAMRELYKKLPRWNMNEFEVELWHLDQTINARGFLCDVDLAKTAVKELKKYKTLTDNSAFEMTGGRVSAGTQRDAMLKHIAEDYGITLPDLKQSTIERRLNDPDLPEGLKEILRVRLASSGTATSKFSTLLKSVGPDGRLRGTLQFCGAPRSGRWSGRLFQPQNLPRPTMKNKDIEHGINALKAGYADVLYDVKDLCTSALRGVLVAPQGAKLVVSDLSAIEGRVVAWLAGENWKIKAYVNYDAGRGYDLYTLTYAKAFGVPAINVDKKKRQLGKILELALGYGGGVGAFMTFAQGYGIDLQDIADAVAGIIPDSVRDKSAYFYDKTNNRHGLSKDVFIACDAVKRMWRDANPNISRYWDLVEKGVRDAVERKQVVTLLRGVTIDTAGKWLRLKLPSGRFICYPGVRISDKISYEGMNQYTRKWSRITSYGGKFVENITQSVARDILAVGMTNAEYCGYKVVLSVHDELITETPDTSEYTHKRLSQIMSTHPVWANGLPLAAAGFESYRYRKD